MDEQRLHGCAVVIYSTFQPASCTQSLHSTLNYVNTLAM